MEEVAGSHAVLEAIDRLFVALAIRVVHRGEQVGGPRQLEFHDGQPEAGVALEDTPENQGANPKRRVKSVSLAAARPPERCCSSAQALGLPAQWPFSGQA